MVDQAGVPGVCSCTRLLGREKMQRAGALTRAQAMNAGSEILRHRAARTECPMEGTAMPTQQLCQPMPSSVSSCPPEVPVQSASSKGRRRKRKSEKRGGLRGPDGLPLLHGRTAVLLTLQALCSLLRPVGFLLLGPLPAPSWGQRAATGLGRARPSAKGPHTFSLD